MNEVGDSLDLMTVVIGMVLMIFVGLSCILLLEESFEVDVDDKSAITTTGVAEVPRPALYGRDLVAQLEVIDGYQPNPRKIVYKVTGGPTYTVTLNDVWMKDKEASIKTAYTAFFKNHLNRAVTNMVVTDTEWTITLT